MDGLDRIDRRTTEHTTLTPAQRSLRARIAANKRWASSGNRSAGTAAARAAWMRRFEDQVDPERRLSLEERGRRAEQAMRAHMQAMALQRTRRTA